MCRLRYFYGSMLLPSLCIDNRLFVVPYQIFLALFSCLLYQCVIWPAPALAFKIELCPAYKMVYCSGAHKAFSTCSLMIVNHFALRIIYNLPSILLSEVAQVDIFKIKLVTSIEEFFSIKRSPSNSHYRT